jgi:UrcA family protein
LSRFFSQVLALLFAPVASANVSIADPTDEATRLVFYDDLDLSTPRGVMTLRHRIEAAANAVCLDVNGPSPAVEVNQTCRYHALKDTDRQLELVLARQRQNKPAASAK